ncbi:MAG: ecotin family protein [Candidatus Pacebacteria bacterium]|nr:ecotin family protein [Candidatus Paceibacterota bacterium]
MENFDGSKLKNQSRNLKVKLGNLKMKRAKLEKTVIHLNPMENEIADYKLEIFAEKSGIINCNTHGFSGEFEKMNLKGWGYSYYNFESNGMMPKTLMVCPPNSEREGVLKSKSELVRYNSKLPLVVYSAPEYDIKYRVWSAK